MRSFTISVILFLIAGIMSVPAQIQSNGTDGGLWSNAATWQGGTVPTSTDNVTILGSDSVWTTTATTCNNLTINSGGIFGANTSGQALSVTGTLTMLGTSKFYNNANT